MSSLAAANVAAILQGYPVWESDDISPFLAGEVPRAAPSIVNANDLENKRK
jgi:hydroxypyruvate reductase 1